MSQRCSLGGLAIYFRMWLLGVLFVSCAVYSLEGGNGEVGQLKVTIEAMALFKELVQHGQ